MNLLPYHSQQHTQIMNMSLSPPGVQIAMNSRQVSAKSIKYALLAALSCASVANHSFAASLPVTVTNTVKVTGTVGVSGTIPVSGNVNVTNTSPVPVSGAVSVGNFSDLGKILSVGTPFTTTLACNPNGNATTSISCATNAVYAPTGTRIVLETIAYSVVGGATLTSATCSNQTTGLWLPLSPTPGQPFNAISPMKLYLPDYIYCVLNWDTPTGNVLPAQITFSGTFVPTP